MLGYSRDAYYKSRKRKQIRESAELKVLELVKRERWILRKSGVRKLYECIKGELVSLGIKMGRDKLYKLLRESGLLVKRKRYRMPVTDSKHPFRKHKNLVKEKVVNRIDEVWVSDITYLKVGEKWHYLTLIMDDYSRKIMGYSFSRGMSVKETTERALKMALNTKKSRGRTIFHSDRGLQYCNPGFIARLNRNGLVPSMTENSDPYENAKAERLNGTLKNELDLGLGFKTYEIAKKEIRKVVKLYNEYRLHWSLRLKTPEAVYARELRQLKLTD